MEQEKRMAGDYEIINSIHIGDKEIVLGENQNARDNMKYFCSYCESNELFMRYDDAMVSDDFAEIVELYGQRIAEQAEKTRTEIENIAVDKNIITADQCYPLNYTESLKGSIIAIKSDVIRREYRRADRQLFLVTGGNGAKSNARGSAVFCTNLYDGKTTRWERFDVQGIVKEDYLPNWAKEKAQVLKRIEKSERVNER